MVFYAPNLSEEMYRMGATLNFFYSAGLCPPLAGRKEHPAFLSVVMAILATALVVRDLEPLSQLDRITYDVMLRKLVQKHSNPKVMVVDVDEG
jgi:hypothetical protein